MGGKHYGRVIRADGRIALREGHKGGWADNGRTGGRADGRMGGRVDSITGGTEGRWGQKVVQIASQIASYEHPGSWNESKMVSMGGAQTQKSIGYSLRANAQ
jgi:hypothetical protein